MACYTVRIYDDQNQEIWTWIYSLKSEVPVNPPTMDVLSDIEKQIKESPNVATRWASFGVETENGVTVAAYDRDHWTYC